ncbi:MAG TPA: type VI secretion system membrane subunit TssM [Casimicrobiaceae bacterium]|jgi:type VI secretion system protein ImpL|nr:type VI secretion system membrane subunit TssM [Casimicrobiaceae bacterium]
MKRLGALLRSRPFWAFVGLVLVAFLIWWRGAIVAFGETRPLATDVAQWTLIGALFALYVLWLAIRWWREKDLNARLLSHIAKASTDAAPAQGAEEVEELRKRFESAVNVLKNAKLRGNAPSAVAQFGGQYVYQLPWYIFVGSPGSGKTTALVNSGLQFPLAEQFGKAAIRGVGGTRNCDWWFTNDAVLIDTAGRYTSQDSNEAADKAEWDGFLKLLRQFRPRQPINGVLLTVSVTDLLSQTPAERLVHVSMLRQRLEELRSGLRIQFPVYVLITKVDLIGGFTDYFESLSRDERAQVWGFTFPYRAEGDAGHDFASAFRSEFELLTRRLYSGVPDLLLAKRDLKGRALAYAFPQEFAVLQDVLEQFLAPLFTQSKFRDAPLMRGIYFTSGTQEGTPFDRVLGALERKFKVDARVDSPVARSTGKSYFLQTLLERVIFSESHLAGRDWRRERTLNMLRVAGYGAVAATLAVLVVGWTTSYRHNKDYLARVATRVAALHESASKSVPDERPPAVVPLLDETRRVADPEAFAVDAPPLAWRFGLYQGSGLDAAADATYRQLLTEAFLPRVARYAEASLQEAVDRDDLGLVYRRLKDYLMLHDADHYDAKALVASLTLDLTDEYDVASSTRKDVREAIARHLHGLLDAQPVSSPYVIDDALVREAREHLARVAPAQRVYRRIKAELANRAFPDFKLSENSGDKGTQVFRRASGETELRGVPGLFTFNGYHDGFSKEVDKLALSMGGEEAWVLGESAAGAGIAQRTSALRDRFDARLAREVRDLYMYDYVAEWKRFVDDIELRPTPTLADSIRVTRILAGPDSPLPVLIRAIVRETTLSPDKTGGDSIVQSAAGAIVNKGKEIARSRTSIDLNAAAGSTPRADKPEQIVDAQFADLRRLVAQPAQGKPPIDDTLATFRALSDYFVRLQSARDGNLTPPDRETIVRAQTSTDPEPIRRMLLTLAGAGSGQAVEIAKSTIAASIGGAVGDACHRRVDGRYPFFRDSSTDVGAADFAALFRPNGIFDEYFQKNLADKVNMSTRPWKLREGSGVTSIPGLAAFMQAAQIRDAFFANGSGEASFQIDLRLRTLDPSIKEVVLAVDGQTLNFSTASPGPRTIRWPASTGAHSVRLSAVPDSGGAIEASGTWALHRLFRHARLSATDRPEAMRATFTVGGHPAEFDVVAQSVENPLQLPALEQFRCPPKS